MIGFFYPDRRYASREALHFYRTQQCFFCTALAQQWGNLGRLLFCHEAALLHLLLGEISPRRQEITADGDKIYRCHVRCLVKRKGHGLPAVHFPETLLPIALSGYLVYLKFYDDAQDAPGWRTRSLARLVQKIGVQTRQGLAAAGVPLAHLDNLLQRQREVETIKGLTMTQYVAPTAESFACVYEGGGQDGQARRQLATIGRSLGTILVLSDAILDYDADQRQGQYNLLAWTNEAQTEYLPQSIKQEARHMIETAFAEGLQAMRLLGTPHTERLFLSMQQRIWDVARSGEPLCRVPRRNLVARWGLPMFGALALGAALPFWFLLLLVGVAVLYAILSWSADRRRLHQTARSRGLLFQKGNFGYFLDAPARLVLKLQNAKDPVSLALRQCLSLETLNFLQQYHTPDHTPDTPHGQPLATEFKEALIADVVNVVQGACFYQPSRFAQIQLPEFIQQLLEQNPTGDKLCELNCRLLAAAYPDEIVKLHMRMLQSESGDGSCCLDSCLNSCDICNCLSRLSPDNCCGNSAGEGTSGCGEGASGCGDGASGCGEGAGGCCDGAASGCNC